jgi:short-subunit dehydrogenase
MKKLLVILAISMALSTATAFANTSNNLFESLVNSASFGSFKILNDTDNDVQIYTGSGFVELNKGASTSLTCEAGKEIRSANKGKKGDVIFTVDDSMCGKTVKLSKYL